MSRTVRIARAGNLAVALGVLAVCLASVAEAGTIITIDAHTNNARLIDNGVDDQGDLANVTSGSEIGVGENNGGTPSSDEGRWWLPFDITGYEQAIAEATSVRVSMQTNHKNNATGYQLDIHGYPNRTSTTPVPADYQAQANLLVASAFTATTPDDVMQTFNVTDFVQAEAAAGNPLAVFRVQVAPETLPNGDGARNNFIMRTADAPAGQRPVLTITPPPEFHEVRDFSNFAFTTAAKNGQSPATAGAFAGAELFVRNRTSSETPEQPALKVQAFLEFDLADLGQTKIDRAVLLLHEYDKLNSIHSEELLIGQVADAWDLDGNRPAYDQALVDGTEFIFGDNGPASAGPAVDILHEIDVTDIVQAWQLDPSSNHGFRLAIDAGFVGAAFNHTGDLAPLLVVTYGVPEPASAALLGCGLLLGIPLLVRFRRRRTSPRQ